MQRSISSAKNVHRNLLQYHKSPNAAIITRQQPPCDIFINHRGIDTKKNVAGLLYHHLKRLRLRPFLDSKNMKPGDKLFNNIDSAISACKVGVAVFSPRYCQSYFCLHELARIMESKKKVIPVFCDIKPSELIVKDDQKVPKHELDRFRLALEEAKYTVGLTFNSSNGDWPEFLMTATEAIIENMIELEQEEQEQQKLISQHNRNALIDKFH
nr:Toll/interleukin-1 receptor homology (TIR) domain-containing protein [Tanacetum cinerariifolium]GEY34618.1 Toll/interleukin-1 receptor homology (TIR) domain-containing protein [Tanacetum cinerariifolium]